MSTFWVSICGSLASTCAHQRMASCLARLTSNSRPSDRFHMQSSGLTSSGSAPSKIGGCPLRPTWELQHDGL